MGKESGAKLAVKLLRDEALSIEDRNLLTTALLEKLGALPTRARIQLETSATGQVIRILLDGQPLNERTTQRLARAARSLQNNFAHKLVQETLDFMAIKQGVHFNVNPEQGLFAKAILWQHNEERQLYEALAQGVIGD